MLKVDKQENLLSHISPRPDKLNYIWIFRAESFHREMRDLVVPSATLRMTTKTTISKVDIFQRIVQCKRPVFQF